MSPTEFAAFWIAAGLYLLASGLALLGLVFHKERLLSGAVITCWVAFASHAVAIGARILYTRHIPVASLYENILTGAAVVILFCLMTILKRPSLQSILVFGAPFTLLMMGYSLLSQPSYTTMSLVLDNLWMFVHIFFAWLAYGSYSAATGLSMVLLLRGRYEDRSPSEIPAIYRRVPETPLLDDLVLRVIIFGFVTHALMVASGSIWARDLWGTYWNWDPVETWSLVSWILYGLWIHLRLTFKWRGRRMAWLAIAAFLTVLLAFWGTTLLGPTEHSLDALKLRTESTP